MLQYISSMKYIINASFCCRGESRACLTSPDNSTSSSSLVLAARKCLSASDKSLGDADTETLPCLEEGQLALLHCLRDVRSLSKMEVELPMIAEGDNSVCLVNREEEADFADGASSPLDLQSRTCSSPDLGGENTELLPCISVSEGGAVSLSSIGMQFDTMACQGQNDSNAKENDDEKEAENLSDEEEEEKKEDELVDRFMCFNDDGDFQVLIQISYITFSRQTN